MPTLNELNGTYVLDPSHTEIGFVTRHAMVTKVRGSFTDFSGTATTGTNLEGAKIEVAINVDSIDTRSADRDAHLRSADFFDIENFPQITFTSTSIEASDIAGDDEVLRVTGDLTIKDVTKPVTIEFEYAGEVVDAFGNTRVGLEGSVQVLRSEFGLTWNVALEAGGVLVSDKVTLQFEIAAVKQA
ncbi:Polyisoprenoid-binding protein YceI [Ruaniaceae bacterium KH17]|nr:Polyisoprenoid-binding protein YceI [Ruaniaceae bacterium KH17]